MSILTRCRLSDTTSRTVAQVNSLVTGTVGNPFILQRNLQASSRIAEADKPFGFQSSAFQKNLDGLALSSQKYEGAVRSSLDAIKAHPAPTLDPSANTASVLNFAAHVRNKTGKEAIKTVLPELEKRPKDVGLVLVVVQLYVLMGNNDAATSLLEDFLSKLSTSTKKSDQDVRNAPGLVATMVSLYSSRGQASHVRKELSQAAAHWQEKVKSSAEDLTPSVVNLLKTAGGALLASPMEQDHSLAQGIFEDLRSHSDSDAYIAAGVIASASSNVSQSQLASLTPVDRLTSSISVDELEAAGIARPPQASGVAKTATKRAAEPSKVEKKAKKPKPSKLPKDYDENKKPDPERWLPLRDRSGYRPKGKKGKQRTNMLAQGAVEEISRPGTPGTPVEKQTGGGGKQAQKKKKGKGNKW